MMTNIAGKCKNARRFYFFMKGPLYIYQGQEIGMTNVQFPNIEEMIMFP